MSWKDTLKHGFVAGILGIILFGFTWFFDFYGFREYLPAIVVGLPIFLLPPMGLFFLMGRKKKVEPSVVGATEPPRVMTNESALQQLERLKKETPAERLERLKTDAATTIKARETTVAPTTSETSPPSTEPQAPTKAPATGYCVKCKAMRVIFEPKSDVAKNGTPRIKGTCPECSTQIFTFGVNGQMDNGVPIPYTITIAGRQYEFEYGISAAELIRKGKRKGV